MLCRGDCSRAEKQQQKQEPYHDWWIWCIGIRKIPNVLDVPKSKAEEHIQGTVGYM
jgi:hypothetical protein